MTTVTVKTEVPSRGKTEDGSICCGSSSAHIIEETEYVRKVWGRQLSCAWRGCLMTRTSMGLWTLFPHPCNMKRDEPLLAKESQQLRFKHSFISLEYKPVLYIHVKWNDFLHSVELNNGQEVSEHLWHLVYSPSFTAGYPAAL